jgi:hypothetical protein
MRRLPPQRVNHRTCIVLRHGRLWRRCRARLEWLEDRTLLSGTPADVLAGIAIPIALGTPRSGMLPAGDTLFYQVNPTAEGKLVAEVHAVGGTTRLTLLNGQNQVLMESAGPPHLKFNT